MSRLSVALDTRGGRVVVVIARLLVAAVMAFAAVPKLLDPATFAAAVDNYHLLPTDLVGPVAAIVPVVELVVAGALIAGLHARGAAIVAIAMLVTFTAGMGQAMARGIDLECGCFGNAARAQVGWDSIARNVALVLVSLVVVLAKDVPWRNLGKNPPRTSGTTAP